MAALSHQRPSLTGTALTYSAASGGGDTAPIGTSGTILHVKNGSGSSINVTVTSVDLCNQGAQHDLVVAVAAGAEKIIGPLSARFANASDGLIHISYSLATSVTVAVIPATA